MNLDEAQRRTVAEWIAQGLKLSEIQNRLASELGLKMTYMEVRLLVDDLKLVPRDIEPTKPAAAPPDAVEGPPTASAFEKQPTGARAGEVAVSVDRLTRPGALVSGKVTFTDGVTADWYMDQSGRLGVVAPEQGYRPPPTDMRQFQEALDAELGKAGF